MDLRNLMLPTQLKEDEEKKQSVQSNQSVQPAVANPLETPNNQLIEQQSRPASPDIPFIEPIAPAPVIERIETGSTTTATSRQMPTAQESTLMKEKDSLLEQQIANEQKAAEAGRLKAIEDQKAAEEKARLTEEQMLKKQELIQKQEDLYNQALAESNAQYEQLKGMKIKDYWSDKSTGEKIMAGIGIALGGLAGGSNQALAAVQKRMDDDLARQKANIEKQIEVVNQARGQMKITKDQQDYLLNNINIIGEAAYAKVADTLAANLKKQGLNDAQIESDKRVLEMRQKANDYKLQREEGLRKSVQTSTTQKQFTTQERPGEPEKVTEGQAKARGFGERMASAVQEYDKAGGISGETADKIRKHIKENTIIDQDANGVIRYFWKPGVDPIPPGLSAAEQQAALAVTEFARAKLRKESGAAIGAAEFEQELNQYLPTTRDKPGTIKAKRALMSTAIKSLQPEMGKVKLNIPEPKTAQQQAETKSINGKTYKKTTGGWIEVE